MPWIERAKPVYARIEKEAPLIDLLNTTIRFTWDDHSEIKLSYSRSPAGSYAFVLYYRLQRTKEADAQLMEAHQAFSKITLELGGTFYLPYRHHYSVEEMDRAYPAARDFFARKQHYDPTCMFTSQWYDAYGLRFWEAAKESTHVIPSVLPGGDAVARSSDIRIVSEHRSDSYVRLTRDPRMRKLFQEAFLVNIFNVEDHNKLHGLMMQAVWHPRNKGDDQLIFEHLQQLLQERGGGAMNEANRMWKKVLLLRAQKHELSREMRSILGHLGRVGTLVGYVSVGDNGKLVQEYRRCLGVRGRSWVINDTNPDQARVPTLAEVLERGSPEPVGEYLAFDYERVDPWHTIEDESCDLVTMNQGLHHLPAVVTITIYGHTTLDSPPC